ncbi:class I SAM-dependent methyltransferase [Corynebacterium vitaeruminis]|uniref:class I SAM-dependent methyltransferase n=1 Tax=Corynebacterium vitaeruminis TaxID=38305 RepID=UPI0005501301|nr:class I SAM-dependent methyltransferase [Corynebacterium vitaeruminis]
MPTWTDITTRNPQHSRNYAARWKNMEAEGRDIVGEARLIDAMVPRGSRILDAGCGTGRVGGYLQQAGHSVVGVDLDPYLIEVAREDFPEATWEVGNLAEEGSIPEADFEAIVCAGNVITFLAPEERQPALQNLFAALAPGGRAVIGFGAGRGLPFPAFLEAASAVGFRVDATFSTWDLRPFDPQSSDFLVAVLSK